MCNIIPIQIRSDILTKVLQLRNDASEAVIRVTTIAIKRHLDAPKVVIDSIVATGLIRDYIFGITF